MTPAPKRSKYVSVSGSVTRGHYKVLDDYRWANRKTPSEAIRDAIGELAKSLGVEVLSDEAIDVLEAAEAATDSDELDLPVVAADAPGKGANKT